MTALFSYDIDRAIIMRFHCTKSSLKKNKLYSVRNLIGFGICFRLLVQVHNSEIKSCNAAKN